MYMIAFILSNSKHDFRWLDYWLWYKSYKILYNKPIPLFKEHVLVGNALDWQKFNWHKSHRRNGYPQLTQKDSKQHTLLFSFVSMFTPKLWFSLQFVPLASISINHLLAKRPVLKESFIFNSTQQMFIWFHACHYLF